MFPFPLAIRLLSLFFFLLIGAAEAPNEGACLNVMTFNIRLGTAADGENSWPERKELLVTTIRDHSPDVLGLQEALRFQIDELREAFPEYNEVGVGRDDGKEGGEYSPILFRSSRLSVLSTGTFWFSDTPAQPGSKSWGNHYPRICTWANFADRSTRDTMMVLNVHWDHESQRSRERSAELLLQHIQKTVGEMPIVVMGDFNAGEENTAVLLLKKLLRDSFRDIHPADSLTGTFHAFLGTHSGEKIDHIFVNSRFTVTNASIVRTGKNGRYPSDHFPVTAMVCLPEKP